MGRGNKKKKKPKTNAQDKTFCCCLSAQQLRFVLHPPVSHLLHSTVIFPRLKRWLFLLYTNVLLSFRLSLFKKNICNGKSTRSNLLQLFLSCHQGDAVRRARVEPWGGGKAGGEREREGVGKGGPKPPTPVCMCTYVYLGLVCAYIHIHVRAVLYNKYLSTTDHLRVCLLSLLLARTFSSSDASIAKGGKKNLYCFMPCCTRCQYTG